VQARDPKEVVRSVLEPGERMIWCGRPDVEVVMATAPRRSGSFVFIIVLAMGAGFAVFQAREFGIEPADLLDLIRARVPSFLYILGGMVLLPIALRVFKLDRWSRYRQHFENLTYGVTDRRVLIIEKDSVLAFAGDELDRPRVEERAGGYGDVIFGRMPESSDNSSGNKDPVARARRSVGFKALPNAEEVRVRLEQWIAGELEESANAVSDFLEAQHDPAPSAFATPEGMATLRHSSTRMKIDYPDEWAVQVRKKKKPFGKTFLDREKWGTPGDVADWNMLRIEGPSGCSIDAEIFETPMLASYDSLATSKLAALMGELVDSDSEYTQHGMNGFTVTRRSTFQPNTSTGTVGAASVVTPFRYTVLHDGRYQVMVLSKWPERSPELTSAVDFVVRSLRIAP
jgi:hypothetical protein